MKPKLLNWGNAFIKRLLVNKRMCLIFLIFPILCLGIRIYCQQNYMPLRVALFCNGDNPMAEDSVNALTHMEGIVHFYKVDSADEVYRDVENTSAECGYIFTDSYTNDHLLESNLWKDSVKVIRSPESTVVGSVNELVFSVFFEHYNQALLRDYLSTDGILKHKNDIRDAVKDADALFEEHLTDGSTFSFVSNQSTDSANVRDAEHASSALMSSFLSNAGRGILSVLLLLSALCGGIIYREDQKSCLFLPLPRNMRPRIELLDSAAPVWVMGISGLIGLLILPAHRPVITEVVCLLLYMLLLPQLIYLMLGIMRSQSLFHILIPILTLCSLVLTPVFLDLSTYSKIFTIPKYLLPGSYYLEAVLAGSQAIGRLVIANLIIGAITWMYSHKRAS